MTMFRVADQLLKAVTRWVDYVLTPCDEDEADEIVHVGEQEMEWYKDDLMERILINVEVMDENEEDYVCMFYTSVLNQLHYITHDKDDNICQWVLDDIKYLHENLRRIENE